MSHRSPDPSQPSVGRIGRLLGLESVGPPAPLPTAEVKLSNGDIVELLDGQPRLATVIARLVKGRTVVRLFDGTNYMLVMLDGKGSYWEFDPMDTPPQGGEVIAETVLDDEVAVLYGEGHKYWVIIDEDCWGVDSATPATVGATWTGSVDDDKGVGGTWL